MTIRLIFSTVCSGLIGTLIKKNNWFPSHEIDNQWRKRVSRPAGRGEENERGSLEKAVTHTHMYSYTYIYTLQFMNTQVIIISFVFLNQWFSLQVKLIVVKVLLGFDWDRMYHMSLTLSCWLVFISITFPPPPAVLYLLCSRGSRSCLERTLCISNTS